MAFLDGKEKIAPTPFDAHEKVVRGPHSHDPEKGYEPKTYKRQEFPKSVEDGVDEDGKPKFKIVTE